jgi:hypothetical protein
VNSLKVIVSYVSPIIYEYGLGVIELAVTVPVCACMFRVKVNDDVWPPLAIPVTVIL